MKLLLCPSPTCDGLVKLEDVECMSCTTQIAFHPPSLTFAEVTEAPLAIGGLTWRACSNREWRCNWLVADESEAARCFSCRLTRTAPDSDDTIALERLADSAVAKRQLLVQLNRLGMPVDPWFEHEGGLGFDLISSISENRQVMIGHANGIVTIDLAESLDDYRERLRVKLGEPYRTMLGHFRHEVGHYYEWILVEQTHWIDEARRLFGDERASYSDAIDRHYKFGAPANWQESHISEYATMHPWEDFAECFAHYLHITDTVGTAAAAGLELWTRRHDDSQPDLAVLPQPEYGVDDFDGLLGDWYWLARFFNRINHAMGKGDLYPFTISPPVAEKLRFIHRVVNALPATRVEPTDGFRRRAARTRI